VTVRDIIPASDNSSEMAEVAEAIGHIASQIALTRATGGDTAKLESAQAVNERNLAALANEPRKEARTIERETDETWAERWEAMDAKGRNAFLRDQGVRAEAARRADGRYFVKVWGPWLTPEEAGYEADPAL